MKKFIQEFKTFALRGNMMDMAVGVIIGGAFSTHTLPENLLTGESRSLPPAYHMVFPPARAVRLPDVSLLQGQGQGRAFHR